MASTPSLNASSRELVILTALLPSRPAGVLPAAARRESAEAPPDPADPAPVAAGVVYTAATEWPPRPAPLSVQLPTRS
jgi:hypothetical protein